MPIDYLELVKEFHVKYGHHIQERPYWPPYPITDLRDRLIEEESGEFFISRSLIDKADAIADLLYVVFGAALAYGIPIEEIFLEVHRSNMTKEGTNKFGKTLKGPNYSPPDIERIMKEHMKGKV